MWEGAGWRKTRRQLGVAAFIVVLILEATLHVGFPIALYSVILALLGYDLLDEAFERLRTPLPRRREGEK